LSYRSMEVLLSSQTEGL